MGGFCIGLHSRILARRQKKEGGANSDTNDDTRENERDGHPMTFGRIASFTHNTGRRLHKTRVLGRIFRILADITMRLIDRDRIRRIVALQEWIHRLNRHFFRLRQQPLFIRNRSG